MKKAASIVSDMLRHERCVAKIGSKACKLRECSDCFLQPQVEAIALDSTGVESSTCQHSGDRDISNAIKISQVEDVTTASLPHKTVDVLFKEIVHVLSELIDTGLCKCKSKFAAAEKHISD